MDSFRVVLLVRTGDAGPVVGELLASGYPLSRATTPADAVRQAAMGPSFLVIDAQNAPKLGADLLPTLTPLVQAGSVRVCLLDDADAVPVQPLVTTTLMAALDLDDQLEQLAQILWMNQRATPRAEVALLATFISPDGGLREGSVRSLSEGGALFGSLDPPAIGMTGRLRIVDQDGQVLEIEAQVMNERRMEKAAGVRFLRNSGAAMDHIRRIVQGALGLGSRRASEHVVAVYDPSKLVRKVTSLVLGQAGYEVAECEKLPELMSLLAGPSAPAVLLLDPTSSTLGGERLKEVIKRAAGKCKVVFHTSAADDVVKKAQAATGVTLHIRKGAFADTFIGRMGAIVAG